MGRDRAHLSGLFALALGALGAALSCGTANAAGPVARVTIENATGGAIRLQPGVDLIGTAMPPLAAEIAAGARDGPVAIASPNPSAAGGRFSYADARGRRCTFVLARTRTSLGGPYIWPTVRATAEPGLACRAEIVDAPPNGDFSVLILIE